MTAKDLGSLIGKEGYVRMGASSDAHNRVRVDIRIVDARTAYGRTDVLVEPLAGAGKAWVSLDNVTLYEGAS